MAVKRQGLKSYYWAAIAFLAVFALILILKVKDWAAEAIALEQYRTNLIWVTDNQIKWASLSTVDGQMSVFEISPEMMVPVVGMQGEMRSQVLWKFGEGER